ncbi:hypothetical protein [Alteromonas sp. 14N.309.X.WAT.G.H12]|uniref:hypothetical protein n=1 Tax=Alteromonas sp. 14N.309.X.WAT.G.H12 TaxID=3120824 RepID=UPI002FD4309E
MENLTDLESTITFTQWVNFRFVMAEPTDERKLTDSIERTVEELSCLYGSHCQFFCDFTSNIDTTKYPFFKTDDADVVVQERSQPLLDFPVYSNGRLISADRNIADNMEELPPDEFITLSYKEQFVFRVTVWVNEERTEHEAFVNMLTNLVDNASLPSVNLLSIEASSSFIDLNSLLSRQKCKKAQPILGLKNRSPRSFVPFGKSKQAALQGVVDDLLASTERSHEALIQLAETRSVDLGSEKIQFLTSMGYKRHDKLAEVAAGISLLSTKPSTRLYPIWICVAIESAEHGRITTFFRYLELPPFDLVEAGFELARSYPVSGLFNNKGGGEYNRVLQLMLGRKFDQFLEYGIGLYKNVTKEGQVLFKLAIHTTEHDEAATLLYEGSEIEVCNYLQELLKALPEQGRFTGDDILREIEDLSFEKRE